MASWTVEGGPGKRTATWRADADECEGGKGGRIGEPGAVTTRINRGDAETLEH